jgi:hypothetical protein
MWQIESFKIEVGKPKTMKCEAGSMLLIVLVEGIAMAHIKNEKDIVLMRTDGTSKILIRSETECMIDTCRHVSAHVWTLRIRSPPSESSGANLLRIGANNLKMEGNGFRVIFVIRGVMQVSFSKRTSGTAMTERRTTLELEADNFFLIPHRQPIMVSSCGAEELWFVDTVL